MTSDFYIVLGISRNADAKKIKQAYRKIVKQYHPDTAELARDPEKFREIQEAYETLGDEKKRRKYDTKLTKIEKPSSRSHMEINTSRRPSVLDEMDPYYSFTDEFFEGFLPGFFIKNRFQSPVKDMYLEAILSPREAREGGMFPITIPIIKPCPQCQPPALWDRFFCPACNGYGKIQSYREFSLSIPPNINDGTEISISLEDTGLKYIRLYIHVVVDPHRADEEW
jgi:DnaJ-class molecular chaperone